MPPYSILQVGHGRDGRRPLVKAAHKIGARIFLVENVMGRPASERAGFFGEPNFDGEVFVEDLHHSAIVQAIHQIDATNEIGLVVAGFELFTATACRAASELGVPQASSLKIIESFRFKSRQRTILQQSSPEVLQPQFKICSSLREAIEAATKIGFPCVLKADDSGGSLGVSAVRDSDDIEKAYSRLETLQLDDGNQTNGLVLVEEMIEGPELGIQGVVDSGGQVALLAMTRKTIDTGPSGNSFMERCHVACPATDMPHPVREFAGRVIAGLGLKGSPFHIDVRLSNRGPVLIETGARLSGAFVPRLIEKATGVDWADLALAAWSQQKVTVPELSRRYSGGLFVSPHMAGQVQGFRLGISGIEMTADEEVLVDFLVANQSVGGGYRHVSDRIGFLQATANSPTRVREILDAIRFMVAMRGGGS